MIQYAPCKVKMFPAYLNNLNLTLKIGGWTGFKLGGALLKKLEKVREKWLNDHP